MSVTCLTMATKFKLNQDFLKIFVSDCKNDFFEELRMTGSWKGYVELFLIDYIAI